MASPANAKSYEIVFNPGEVGGDEYRQTAYFDQSGTLDGQVGSIAVEVNVGDVIEMPAAPTRDGYTFKYWKGSEFYPGNKYTVEGDHAFTAVWEKNSSDSGDGGGDGDAKGASASGASSRGSSPKTGDALGGFVGALAAVAALVSGIAALWTRRRIVK